MMYGISDVHFKILKEKLVDPLKKQGARVWIFGSRAVGTHKEFSDVDIAYELPAGVTPNTGFISTLLYEIEESRFPYKLDLVSWPDLAESYKQNALSQRQQL